MLIKWLKNMFNFEQKELYEPGAIRIIEKHFDSGKPYYIREIFNGRWKPEMCTCYRTVSKNMPFGGSVDKVCAINYKYQHYFLSLEDAKNFKEQFEDIYYKNYVIHIRDSTNEDLIYDTKYFCKNLYCYWSNGQECFYQKFHSLDEIKKAIDKDIRLNNLKDEVVVILPQ